jgi:hypothetical protein
MAAFDKYIRLQKSRRSEIGDFHAPNTFQAGDCRARGRDASSRSGANEQVPAESDEQQPVWKAHPNARSASEGLEVTEPSDLTGVIKAHLVFERENQADNILMIALSPHIKVTLDIRQLLLAYDLARGQFLYGRGGLIVLVEQHVDLRECGMFETPPVRHQVQKAKSRFECLSYFLNALIEGEGFLL